MSIKVSTQSSELSMLLQCVLPASLAGVSARALTPVSISCMEAELSCPHARLLSITRRGTMAALNSPNELLLQKLHVTLLVARVTFTPHTDSSAAALDLGIQGFGLLCRQHLLPFCSDTVGCRQIHFGSWGAVICLTCPSALVHSVFCRTARPPCGC